MNTEEPVTEEKKEQLRKEFQDFADSIVWQNDDGTEKYIGVGNMFDWWMDRINVLFASKREKIAGLKKSEGQQIVDSITVAQNWANPVYNQAITDVLLILEE